MSLGCYCRHCHVSCSTLCIYYITTYYKNTTILLHTYIKIKERDLYFILLIYILYLPHTNIDKMVRSFRIFRCHFPFTGGFREIEIMLMSIALEKIGEFVGSYQTLLILQLEDSTKNLYSDSACSKSTVFKKGRFWRAWNPKPPGSPFS